MSAFTIDPKTIDWDSAEIDDVYFNDYPDFCDAYFSHVTRLDGTELNDQELETLRDEHPDKLWDRIMNIYF